MPCHVADFARQRTCAQPAARIRRTFVKLPPRNPRSAHAWSWRATRARTALVRSIIYDEQLARATGVKVIDAETQQESRFQARIIFVNASALNTNLILLNSKVRGLLGTHIGFHNYRAGMRECAMDLATITGHRWAGVAGRACSGGR